MALQARRIDTLQTVELAEGMEIHLRVAGPFLRLMAYLLDLLVEFGALMLLGLLIQISFPILGVNVGEAFSLLGLFFIWWFYHVIFEVSRWG